MGNVIKCLGCGAYYNGSVYSSCPYCNVGGAKRGSTHVSEKTEKRGILALFGKIRNTEKPAAERTEKSAEVTKPEVIPTEEKSGGTDGSIPQIQTENIERETKPIFNDDPVKTVPVIPKTEPAAGPQNGPEETLSQAISRSGRTVGKYFTNSSGESIAPVVGWLVGVKGASYGKSFPLKSGRNRIGRSHEMDVKLLNDDSVSKTSVAILIFDGKAGIFSILPGESDSLCYVNDEPLYERLVLSGYEEIEFGDASLNKYMFVPFCGERFSWSNYRNSQGE